MKIIKALWHLIFWGLIAVVLVSCSATNVRNDYSLSESTGKLGKAKQTSPADIYANLAAEYLRNKQYAVALKTAKKGLSVDNDHADLHNVVALIYQTLNEKGLAEKHFRKSISLDKYNSYALNAYGSFLCNEKRFDEAFMQFDQAVKNPLYKTTWVAYANAGLCAARNNENDKAEDYFRKSLQHNKYYAVALLAMAELKLKKKNYLSSRAYLQRFNAINTYTPQSLWVGVKSETALGDRGQAASYKLLLLSEFPDSDEAERLGK